MFRYLDPAGHGIRQRRSEHRPGITGRRPDEELSSDLVLASARGAQPRRRLTPFHAGSAASTTWPRFRQFRSTYASRSFHQLWAKGSEVSWRSRRWWPDKSSRAAGQVFEPDRPHKSLHVLGWRLKTKVLVTGLEVTRRPDMPSKSVGGRKLAGGFDSRPPPLPKAPR